MVVVVVWLMTWWVPSRSIRTKWQRKLSYFLYGLPVRRRAKHVGEALHCTRPVRVTRKTVLGDHVHFNGAFIYGGGEVTIGSWTHLGEHLRIFTRNHNYNHGEKIPYDSTFIYKPVEIGDFVWVGAEVILLPGTKIGEGAIIQAGAVVHGEIPPMAIAGGNPAKVFSWRDKEHFEKLKREGKILGKV